MNVAQRVRENYEQRPYPPLGCSRRLRPVWRIAPWEWMDAIWHPPQSPRRILVAGCGTGNEAFALRKRLPEADVVAVDFSARTIDIARERQRKSPGHNAIEFRRADLTAKSFPRTVSSKFDFISCHGVLSYLPQPERALQNLASVLSRDGALYLGVNGACHFSETWRLVLRESGFNPASFRDSCEFRDLLKLCDALADHPTGLIANQSPEYLAGDLFGPVIANRPLDDWLALASRYGFHFRGSYSAHRTLRRALNSGRYAQLVPRSRAEAHLLAERVAPSSFHLLLFSRRPATRTPWDDREKLLRCTVSLTNVYKVGRGRRKSRSTRAMRQFSLRSAP